MDLEAMRVLQEQQLGVICRRQMLACGGVDSDLARLVRRHVLHRVTVGVYVDHNGPLSWEQRAWVAVLRYWPAALAGGSALIAHGLKSPRFQQAASGIAVARQVSDHEFEVAIDEHRSPGRVAGIRLRRLVDFDAQALMHLGPPRVRLEHAVLEVASRSPDVAGAVGVLSDAIQSRRTTAARLDQALARMTRLPRRQFLVRLLADVAEGAFSALEHRYLVDVERRHRLPTAERQRRERRSHGVVFRDVDYAEFGVIVELDGRLGHEWSGGAANDMDRDIDALVDQRVTLRVRWHQVLDPCRLAAAVARILSTRGWGGRPRPCGPSCALAEVLRGSPVSIIVESQAESA